MAEAGDYEPAKHWGGFDFKSARDSYKDVVKRSYNDAVVADVKPDSLIPECLETQSDAPLAIACDVTASMEDWPVTIFSKLPYLEHEGKEYLGENMEISFCAVGDAYSDKYPLQVQPFVKGAELAASLKKLVHEKGGGGSGEESYELPAAYYSRNCNMPKAIRKPIFIFIGDEGIYSTISSHQMTEWAHADLSKVSPRSIFDDLKSKFSVYVIRKPYQSTTNSPSPAETRIQNQWCEFLGDDHVVSLPDPNRVVDVIFGILAKETGRIDYFDKELKDRQGKDKDGAAKINVVLRSLHTVHAKSMKALPARTDRTKSITKRRAGKSGPKSISLLDE